MKSALNELHKTSKFILCCALSSLYCIAGYQFIAGYHQRLVKGSYVELSQLFSGQYFSYFLSKESDFYRTLFIFIEHSGPAALSVFIAVIILSTVTFQYILLDGKKAQQQKHDHLTAKSADIIRVTDSKPHLLECENYYTDCVYVKISDFNGYFDIGVKVTSLEDNIVPKLGVSTHDKPQVGDYRGYHLKKYNDFYIIDDENIREISECYFRVSLNYDDGERCAFGEVEFEIIPITTNDYLSLLKRYQVDEQSLTRDEISIIEKWIELGLSRNNPEAVAYRNQLLRELNV
ncbi:hypothetical protein ACQKPX_12940 [Photobacterium sp. DNB23_23_1]|uniref:Uncharacterized protein n=1 Tax=Photobacterium pectinilyticum TaxID=2906793 RepID=A0ABT1N9Q1_9GAMM|nr:hypothetical protein [Photobacterium sp. ZSDE20]MCQ1061277.1 hypothetical protein [Photobacterium sp. ZSDE20]MDD1829741.1 hypothetical protein [Photobacterium sp. ZSDE20]